MTDALSRERRGEARRAESWRVLFGANGELRPGYLADMSPMGVSIIAENLTVPVGTELEVHFGLNEQQTCGALQMQAVVRHCTSGRMGLQFLNIDDSQREHWWKILRGGR